LEERQREMREDFQAGRSVGVAIVAVRLEWETRGSVSIVSGLFSEDLLCCVPVPESQGERTGAAIAASDKFCGLTFGGVNEWWGFGDVALSHVFLWTYCACITITALTLDKGTT